MSDMIFSLKQIEKKTHGKCVSIVIHSDFFPFEQFLRGVEAFDVVSQALQRVFWLQRKNYSGRDKRTAAGFLICSTLDSHSVPVGPAQVPFSI